LLIRTCVVSDAPDLGARLERILRQPDLLVSRPERKDLDSCLRADAFDLVIATVEAIPLPYTETLAALAELPDRPELVALVGPDQSDERARLQAAGAFAVVDRDLPEASLRRALNTLVRRRREAALAKLRAAAASEAVETDLLAGPAAGSTVMRKLLDLAGRVAGGDSSVLILGETGSGKEWLARWIHERSSRVDGPFVAVNCAALPSELVESELFGHEQGAFTGAHRARRGQFELAHHGTLFLDEIADMPLPAQAKLLRAIQDREIRRVGSERPIRVDARILAATNRAPERAIRDGTLRQDLYYRLNVVSLAVPPLRDRSGDVPALARELLDAIRPRVHRPDVRGLSKAALSALESYAWPGNVRELINVLERAALLCDGPEITPADLPAAVTSGAPAGAAGSEWDDLLDLTMGEARDELVERFEREYLERLLREANGGIGEAARRAGIDERTLYNKMRRYGLRKESFRSG
jgi:DNA-binding NtrC family response regulator